VPNPAPQIAGKATIEEDAAGNLLFSLALEHCPEGKHRIALHENASCGTDGSGAGNRWRINKKDVFSGDVVCKSDGTAQIEGAATGIAKDDPTIVESLKDRTLVLLGLDASQRIACAPIGEMTSYVDTTGTGTDTDQTDTTGQSTADSSSSTDTTDTADTETTGTSETGTEDRLGFEAALSPMILSVNPEKSLRGTATFVEQKNAFIEVSVELTGCPEGMHGVHIHEGSKCGDDGALAGPHWDPEGTEAGDLIGSILCGVDSKGHFHLVTDDLDLTPKSAFNPIGHTIVVQGLDPNNRVACAPIVQN
jgi:Cu/Zn superoxide dismutase